ncbi:hypothetical protein LMG1866_05144 [Achromobacter ruhlandii]|nr:hypothetical protein LMG1866_05144 [Achromobacter ruhlandii]
MDIQRRPPRHRQPAAQRVGGCRAIAEFQGSGGDRGVAAVGVGAAQRQHAGAVLGHRACAGNLAAIRRRITAVEDQRGVVDDSARHRAGGPAVAQPQRAGGDGGAAGVVIVGGQGQRIGPLLGDRAGAGNQARERQVIAAIEDQRGIVEYGPGHGARDTAVAQPQRAGADGRAAGVGMIPGQRQHACAFRALPLGHRSGSGNPAGIGDVIVTHERHAAQGRNVDIPQHGAGRAVVADLKHVVVGVGDAGAAGVSVVASQNQPAALMMQRARAGNRIAVRSNPLKLVPKGQRPFIDDITRQHAVVASSHHQLAAFDGGDAAVRRAIAQQGQGVGSLLSDRAGAGNHARVGHRIAAVENQRGVFGQRDRPGHGAGDAAVAQPQRAALDRGLAGVGVGAGQRQHARPLLGQGGARPALLRQRLADGVILPRVERERAVRQRGAGIPAQAVVCQVAFVVRRFPDFQHPVIAVIRRVGRVHDNAGEVAHDAVGRAEDHFTAGGSIGQVGQAQGDIPADGHFARRQAGSGGIARQRIVAQQQRRAVRQRNLAAHAQQGRWMDGQRGIFRHRDRPGQRIQGRLGVLGAELQGPGLDRGGAAVGVGAGQECGAASRLGHVARAGDLARVRQAIAAVEDQRALVDDASRHGPRRAAVADAQRAGFDEGLAGIRIRAGQRQGVGALLGDRTRPGDRAAVDHRPRVVEHERGVVDDVARHRPRRAALAQLQRAVFDARTAAVDVVGAQDQGAAALLGQALAVPGGIGLRCIIGQRHGHLQLLAAGHAKRAAGRVVQPIPAQRILQVAAVGAEVGVRRRGCALQQHLAGPPRAGQARRVGRGDQPHWPLVPVFDARGHRAACAKRHALGGQAQAWGEGQGVILTECGRARERERRAIQRKPGVRARRQRAGHRRRDVAEDAQADGMLCIRPGGQRHAAAHCRVALERQAVRAAGKGQRAIARLDAAAGGDRQVAAAQVRPARPDDAAALERGAIGQGLRMPGQIQHGAPRQRQAGAVRQRVVRAGDQRAGFEGGDAGVGVRAGQGQRAGAGQREPAAARDHPRVGQRVAAVENHVTLVDDVASHRAGVAVVPHAQRAGLDGGQPGVGVVAGQDQRTGALLGQAVAVPAAAGAHWRQGRADSECLALAQQEPAMRLGLRVEPAELVSGQVPGAVVGLAGAQQRQVVCAAQIRVRGIAVRDLAADGDVGEIAGDLALRDAEQRHIRGAGGRNTRQIEGGVGADGHAPGPHGLRRFTRPRGGGGRDRQRRTVLQRQIAAQGERAAREPRVRAGADDHVARHPGRGAAPVEDGQLRRAERLVVMRQHNIAIDARPGFEREEVHAAGQADGGAVGARGAVRGEYGGNAFPLHLMLPRASQSAGSASPSRSLDDVAAVGNDQIRAGYGIAPHPAVPAGAALRVTHDAGPIVDHHRRAGAAGPALAAPAALYRGVAGVQDAQAATPDRRSAVAPGVTGAAVDSVIKRVVDTVVIRQRSAHPARAARVACAARAALQDFIVRQDEARPGNPGSARDGNTRGTKDAPSANDAIVRQAQTGALDPIAAGRLPAAARDDRAAVDKHLVFLGVHIRARAEHIRGVSCFPQAPDRFHRIRILLRGQLDVLRTGGGPCAGDRRRKRQDGAQRGGRVVQAERALRGRRACRRRGPIPCLAGRHDGGCCLFVRFLFVRNAMRQGPLVE